VATICLFENEIRRDVAERLHLIPVIQASLSDKRVGVRYAACQCVRALTRGVAVIRTSIVDSGLGISVFNLFKNKNEDWRVVSTALLAVCNVVNNFSPIQPVC
jgi:armadillo repeat-containing protein 8